MNDYNEDITGNTLTLNRLLALGAVSVVMWVGVIHGAIKVWEALL